MLASTRVRGTLAAVCWEYCVAFCFVVVSLRHALLDKSYSDKTVMKLTEQNMILSDG